MLFSVLQRFTPYTAPLLLLLFTAQSQAQSLSPPEYNAVDRASVNMTSGIPSFTVQDVSIGTDSLGLSHSISSYAGFFYGYHDIYGISLTKGEIRRPRNDDEVIPIYTAGYLGGKTIFQDNMDGTYTDFRGNGASLKASGQNWIYTHKDGMEVHYSPFHPDRVFSAFLIRYPNGFEININRLLWRIQSVTTNNGLQLKWHYSRDGFTDFPTIEELDCGSYSTSFCTEHNLPQQLASVNYQRDLEVWDFNMPTSVQAINNGYAWCDPQANGSCGVTNWPDSHYEWHANMPHVMYSEPTVFSVTDMAGKKTSYHHRLYDQSACANQPYVNCPDEGQRFVPRIESVTLTDGSVNAALYNYSYENKTVCKPTSTVGWVPCEVKTPAVLKTATIPASHTSGSSEIRHYTVGESNHSDSYNQSSQSQVSVRTSIDFGVPTSIGYRGTEFLFDYDDVNRLWKSNNGTNATKYQFDSRGNLIKTTLLEKGDDSTYATKENNHSGNTLIQEAGFPSHCNDVTAKTCNKPKWIKDARGHQRDYLYHSKSGQLLVETSPANDKGIRPQTRYHYQQYYAWYHRDDDGQFEAADNPIWLLAEESSCITGSGKASHTAPNIDHATGNLASQQRGCASDADEIKITYHYGQGSATQANNLWLRGKTTTTPDGSRTVCFEYDKLGNVIGETEPLGAVNGCQ